MAGGASLQSAATTGNGNEYNCQGVAGQYVLRVIGAGTITTGELQLEEALTSGYTGTWAPLGPPVTPVSGQVVSVTFSGAPAIVRARISVDVTGSGGSVTVKLQPPLIGE